MTRSSKNTLRSGQVRLKAQAPSRVLAHHDHQTHQISTASPYSCAPERVSEGKGEERVQGLCTVSA